MDGPHSIRDHDLQDKRRKYVSLQSIRKECFLNKATYDLDVLVSGHSSGGSYSPNCKIGTSVKVLVRPY